MSLWHSASYVTSGFSVKPSSCHVVFLGDRLCSASLVQPPSYPQKCFVRDINNLLAGAFEVATSPQAWMAGTAFAIPTQPNRLASRARALDGWRRPMPLRLLPLDNSGCVYYVHVLHLVGDFCFGGVMTTRLGLLRDGYAHSDGLRIGGYTVHRDKNRYSSTAFVSIMFR